MRLNDEQKRAAESLHGQVVVDAGAGSGKTRAMTQRFVNAVDVNAPIREWEPVDVGSVVAITFTEKSAGELAERIRLSLREQGHQGLARRIDAAWISTIHGFCSRILRENALAAGLDPAFGVADTVAAREIFEDVFEREAVALLESSTDAERLFGDRAYDVIAKAVRGLLKELMKHGASPDLLVPEPVVPAQSLIPEIRALSRCSADALEECGASGATAAKYADCCRDIEERLDALATEGLAEEDLARELWDILESARFGGRPAGQAVPVRDAHNERRDELMQAAAAICAAPHTRALITLTQRVGEAFVEAKMSRSLLDFDDLQFHARRLLQDECVAAEYQDRFKLVMVDEFQDTDELQLSLVRAVAGDNLFTVGDERQSIYRFRGADVDVYRGHRAEFRHDGRAPITFDENYRSHAQILGFVNAVFGSAEYFSADLIALKAERDEGTAPPFPDGEPRVEMLLAEKHGNEGSARQVEANAVAARFAELRDGHVFRPQDMVVLVRTWAHVEVYANALRARGFEVVVGGGEFFELPEVQLTMSLLRALANPQDDVALGAVLASPMGALSAGALLALAVRERDTALWEGLEQAEELLGGVDLERAIRTREVVLSGRERAGSERLSSVLLRALEGLDYDLLLFSEGMDGRQRLANVLKLCRMADSFEAAGGSGLSGMVAHLESKIRLGERESAAGLADDGSPAVRIMTIHGSKGLEFPVVAVVGLGKGKGSFGSFYATGWRPDGRLVVASKMVTSAGSKSPDRSALFDTFGEDDDLADEQESKRLLYVAATRAKEMLVLAGWLDPEKSVYDGKGAIHGILRAISEEAGTGDVTVAGEGVDVTVRMTLIPPDEPSESGPPMLRDSSAEESPSHLAETAQARFPGVPDRLSFSALKTFDTCPRRFWFERVLRVGKGEEPQGEAGPLEFGSAVHIALSLAAVEGAETVDPQRMTAIARQHGLSDRQSDDLARAVRAFDVSPHAAAARALPVCRPEMPFVLTIGEGAEGVSLAGAIDLYATDGDEALLVDYKTGESGDADDIRERYELQARCYALAALRAGARTARAVFVRPEVVEADGSMQAVEFGPWTTQESVEIEAELIETRRRMLEGHFEPKPDPGSCMGCTAAYALCADVHPAARESD